MTSNEKYFSETVYFDEIGYWTEIKLDIVKDYAKAYSAILTAKKFTHTYIDGFAGAGVHLSRDTREFVLGSPLNGSRSSRLFTNTSWWTLTEIRLNSCALSRR